MRCYLERQHLMHVYLYQACNDLYRVVKQGQRLQKRPVFHLPNVDAAKVCECVALNKTLIISTARVQYVSGCLVNTETTACKGSFKKECCGDASVTLGGITLTQRQSVVSSISPRLPQPPKVFCEHLTRRPLIFPSQEWDWSSAVWWLCMD